MNQSKSSDNSFQGPVFIVGLSRSGTKLIRDLLNQNDQIAIPDIETHFIPDLLERNLSLVEAYEKVKQSAFIKIYDSRGIALPKLESFEKLLKTDSTTKFIELLLKYYANEGSFKWDEKVIWGDKTPLYLRHLDILEKHFSTSKVVHIIRDPRDRALSVKKTWGKSMYRTTEKWRQEIEDSLPFRKDVNSMIEIRYEDLITHPEKTLTKVCEFLGVPFQEKMLQLKKPSEKHGENSKLLKINKSNTSKYLDSPVKVIKKIEEIAGPLMEEYGYERKYTTKFKPYSKLLMELMKYPDFIFYMYNNFKKGYNKP